MGQSQKRFLFENKKLLKISLALPSTATMEIEEVEPGFFSHAVLTFFNYLLYICLCVLVCNYLHLHAFYSRSGDSWPKKDILVT